MEYTGIGLLGTRYQLNRELTDEECQMQLKQKEHLDVKPLYETCVTHLNSIYLESVDRYFAWRGALSFFGGLFFLVGVYFGLSALRLEIDRQGSFYFFILDVILFGGISAMGAWMASPECFTYTYFPIRLNRRNRKIYVFRPGRPSRSILVVDWDKVFFTLGRCNVGIVPGQEWDIRGHVLADDRKTVIDTFAFAPHHIEQDVLNQKALHRHWEFLRRYMEEGPKEAYETVQICVPVDKKRPSLRLALNLQYMNWYGDGGLAVFVLLSPIWFLFILARWLGDFTNRTPVWPKEMEDDFTIEPSDPYVRDASLNKPNVWPL